jgi:hypothetical protein
MKLIVDTNVAVVANGRERSPQASPSCVLTCVGRLRDLQLRHTLVLDDGWRILREYFRELSPTGQPGVGDAFLKWVLTNQANPRRCEQIHITPRDATRPDGEFCEFPDDPALGGFDPSDRRFVALAVAHAEHPPILNAVDTDWWPYRAALAGHGVQVDFLCSDAMPSTP